MITDGFTVSLGGRDPENACICWIPLMKIAFISNTSDDKFRTVEDAGGRGFNYEHFLLLPKHF